MDKKFGGSGPRNRWIGLAAAGLAVILAAPVAGTAALSNGGFSIKSFDEGTPTIYSVYGNAGAGDSGPEEPEVPVEVPEGPAHTGAPNQMIFSIDTRLDGCTTPLINATSSDYTGKVDWGDGTPAENLMYKPHTYEKPGEYKVTLTGTISSLGSVPAESANCIRRLDFIGASTGLKLMQSAFTDAANLKYVAAPPATVTSTAELFRNSGFNGDISGWETSKITNMSRMFNNATKFNGDISKWNTANVTDMSFMFDGATNFNKPIGDWNVAKVTNFSYMFNKSTSFNQDISKWNLAAARNLSAMFAGASAFNSELPWVTPRITDTSNTFAGATSFNRSLSSWTVTNVTNFNNMFQGATIFNQDISGWNVANGTNMSNMFKDAKAFNQNLALWTPTRVTNMGSMFNGASAFDQDISGWNVTKVTAWGLFAANTSIDKSVKVPLKFRNG